jgi:hypothetical protein
MAYSDAFRTEAIIKLAINKYDYQKTADQVGVPVRTLRNWEKNFPKKGVQDLLERAISRLLMAIPSDMSGHDWSITLGILLDKWLLIQGKATSRVENLFGALEQIGDDELDQLIAEFEQAASIEPSEDREETPKIT